jgi:hypothetical protein
MGRRRRRGWPRRIQPQVSRRTTKHLRRPTRTLRRRRIADPEACSPPPAVFVDEVSETVQLARTSRRFFDPPDRDQAVEDVDDELGRGAWLRTRLVTRRSAPCAYQVTDAQRWLGPPVSRCRR